MSTIYRAKLDTRHFCFEAYGATEEEARFTLDDTLRAHAWQYRLTPGWYMASEIECVPILLARGYRDGALVTATSRAD